MSGKNFSTIIDDIIQTYPEDEWMERCREALPGESDGSIISAIEILTGGDLRMINDYDDDDPYALSEQKDSK